MYVSSLPETRRRELNRTSFHFGTAITRPTENRRGGHLLGKYTSILKTK
ncbi:hypothetical protein OSO01_18710 [Oceanobacillus sojae]|uniref:Uncharacterized protein n=1 Tax=Oceanobacillus sojae TaxID=582851 RepID=A0A511ZI52_9BACI|nr:hypothetical protein OSO01_18710 [Oceanobacillus sojae]